MPKIFRSSRVNELDSTKKYCPMSSGLVLFPTTDIVHDSHKVSLISFFKEGQYGPAYSQGSGLPRVLPP